MIRTASNSFKPKIYGDIILGSNHLITNMNTGILYRYTDDGYYDSRNADPILKQMINDMLNKETTSHKVNEIVGYIERKTGRDISLFDAKNQYVCLLNGNLNLRNMRLEAHSPDRFIPYRIPVTYDKDIDTEPWIKYVEGLVKPDDVYLLQEAVGNLFANHYLNKKLVFAYGRNDSGKSTFLNILQSFLTRANYSSISLHQLGEKFTNAEIYGKRANICSDVPYKMKIRYYSIIKNFTGSDEVTLQFKYKNAFQCTSIAKMFFSGNGIPAINPERTDDAFYRRWQFVEFPRHFDNDDTVFERFTTPEMKSAMLLWAVEGYERLKRNKWHYTNETTVNEAKLLLEDAIYVVDTFEKWLVARCKTFAGWERKDTLFRDCRGWHMERGFTSFPQNISRFGKRILNQSIIPIHEYKPTVEGGQIQAYWGVKIDPR